MHCWLLSPSCSGSSGLTDLTFYLSAPLGYPIGTLNSACLKPNSCCPPLPPEPAQSLVSNSINANFIPPFLALLLPLFDTCIEPYVNLIGSTINRYLVYVESNPFSRIPLPLGPRHHSLSPGPSEQPPQRPPYF